MTISKQVAPRLAFEILNRGFARFSGPDDGKIFDQDRFDVMEPLPVYYLALKDEIAKLEGAVQYGWRYILSGEESTKFADIDIDDDRGEELSFNSVREGAIADRLSEAISIAGDVSNGLDQNYELRLIEVPSLNRAAVWLKGREESIFVPYLDRERLRGKPPAIDRDFLESLQSEVLLRKNTFGEDTGG